MILRHQRSTRTDTLFPYTTLFRSTIGAKQFFGESSISSEFTYQKSTNELYYSELDLATVLPRLTIDTSGKVPSALVDGIDLTDINNYNIRSLTSSGKHYTGDFYAGRLDGDFKIDNSFLRSEEPTSELQSIMRTQ